VALLLHVHLREMERAVATEVTVAREIVDDDLRLAAVKRSPHPGAFLHATASHALENGLRAHRYRRVRWHLGETYLG